MNWHNNERVENRGTILVASSHAVFADIVGEMVAACGFAPAYSAGQEASWLVLTRTQPCIVICDCSAPADGIQRLIVDASARHIPLVLSDARMHRRVDEGSLVLPSQVAWLTFPISRDAFAAMLDALVPSPADIVRRVTAGVAGAATPLAVGVRARLLVLVPPTLPAPHSSEETMDRPRNDRPVNHPTLELTDVEDLRSTIAVALAARPIYDQSLRRAVWTYVGAERDAGMPPGDVILSLTELVEAAGIGPASVDQALTRRVILWCVEAYFGQLGGNAAPRDGDTSDAGPVLVSNR
jgi:hypothetical protein